MLQDVITGWLKSRATRIKVSGKLWQRVGTFLASDSLYTCAQWRLTVDDGTVTHPIQRQQRSVYSGSSISFSQAHAEHIAIRMQRREKRFIGRYSGAPEPHNTTISRLFGRFLETGSVKDKKWSVRPSVLTHEKV
jgi:hypothetical protein